VKNIFLLIGFLLVATFGYTQATPFQKKFPLIDRYIDSFMKDWNIPGLALGIVLKNQLVYAKGYGYRDLENKLPFKTTTLFSIASNTKLFTATAACILAGEGKFNLDKPVRNYLPSLNFSNDELNAKVTLRDMLSHRTGLPPYNGIWKAAPCTRKETVDKIVFMKPQLSFREGYLYNNIMYTAAGVVMETVSGMSWEEIIRKDFFQPLQMTASCFTTEEMAKYGNFASAYFEPHSTRKLQKIPFVVEGPGTSPAGSIKSNIEEMSHWMIAQLNDGKYKDQQAIPQSAIRQTMIPSNIGDKEGTWAELSYSLYGLGRTLQMYKGYKITMHTGSMDGFYSSLTFVPSEGIAVFIVHNNVSAGSVRPVMAFPVIDRLLNLSPTPWSERYRKEYLKAKADEERAKDSINATQVKNTIPSHALKDYAGKYVSPIYGEINIGLWNDSLAVCFRKQRFLLHHFHYDQFVTKEKYFELNFWIQFVTNSSGEINSFTTQPFGDPVAEFIKAKNNE
jgi:CubicO group peptidase (beta-lactamase class C family)